MSDTRAELEIATLTAERDRWIAAAVKQQKARRRAEAEIVRLTSLAVQEQKP